MKLDSSISAVVTGGASGLGKATARMLASHGVRVAVFDFNAERGESLAAEIGGMFCAVDVTREEQVDAAFAKARAAIGQERILVNCAGIGPATKTASRNKTSGAIVHHPLDQFERVIQVNLIGSFRCGAKSSAGMMTLAPIEDEFNSGERGVIINTASVAAQDGQMGQTAYSASKAGIVGMTLPMARDLMAEGIRVNAILPGIFETPLLMSLPDKVRQALGESVPFPKRMGNPVEYAAMVESIARNAYLNGESIRLDGAIRMAPR
jgi:NAD(P)-dependent dehydrogenase (short-subunit alcohol dehydrogenase family)